MPSDRQSIELVEAATVLAEALLSSVGDRLTHTLAVVSRAEELAEGLPDRDRETLLVAALLHDIGYAPRLHRSGMHALDGARFLSAIDFDSRICGLVAHHSGAIFEADERGLVTELADFAGERSPVADALVAADFTTGPQGQRMTVDERIAEILERYDADDPVHRAVTRSQDVLRKQVNRALTRAGQPT